VRGSLSPPCAVCAVDRQRAVGSPQVWSAVIHQASTRCDAVLSGTGTLARGNREKVEKLIGVVVVLLVLFRLTAGSFPCSGQYQ